MSLEEDGKMLFSSKTLNTRSTRYNYLSDKKSSNFQSQIFPNTLRKSSLNQHENADTPVSNPVEITAKNQQEQALLSAIYNTIAISIFFACLGLLAALFIVLEAFLKPIFWALLTSAFLFSSKRYLTDAARFRLADIEKCEKTLAIEFLIAPFQFIDSGINLFWLFLKNNVHRLTGLVIFIILFTIIDSYYDSFLQTLYLFINSIYIITNLVAQYSDNSYQFTLALLIGYGIGITLYWNNGENLLLFQILSFPIWTSLLFHVSKLMGAFRPLFVLIFCVLACLGLVSLINDFFKKAKVFQITTHDEDVDDILNESAGFSSPEQTINKKLDIDNSPDISELNGSIGSPSTPLIFKILSFIKDSLTDREFNPNNISLNKSIKHRKNDQNNNSDKYFFFLFCLFLVVNLRIDTYFVVALIVLVWKLVKNSLFYLYKFMTSLSSFQLYSQIVQEWLQVRSAAIMPKPFVFLLKLFVKGDHRVNQWLQKTMDKIVSGLIILFLLLFIIVGFVVLAMQVHSESVLLVENVFNEKLYSNPQLRQWLPEKERITRVYQEAVNGLYLHGREWIQDRLKTSSFVNNNVSVSILPDESIHNSSYILLEKQLLKQWDTIYLYMSRNNTKTTLDGPNSTLNDTLLVNVQSHDSQTKDGSFLSKAKLYKNTMRIISFVNGKDSFDFAQIAILIKDNFGTLYAFFESFYLIIRGNLQLFSTIIFSLTSIIFTSGFAIISFGFSFIVYCTFLFYLLSMSGSLYKPFQWLSEIIILKTEFSIMSISRSQGLTNAVEESIKSVFLASFKMASFYGLFTYSIYVLFGSSIAAIPAIAAGFFAFLPILATYWASLPGIIELWLIHDQPIKAGLFFLVQILPSYFVDTAIYSEIKGGHSYLTGLAFAGGVYCLGLEGAIIGPIVLCLLIVIAKMLTTGQVKKKLNTLNNSIQIPFKTLNSNN